MADSDDSEPTPAMIAAGELQLMWMRRGDPLAATVERIYRAMRSARGK
jgi:hypothetical protein